MLPDLFETSSENFLTDLAFKTYLNEISSHCTSQSCSSGRILGFTFGSRHLHRCRKNKEPVKIAGIRSRNPHSQQITDKLIKAASWRKDRVDLL